MLKPAVHVLGIAMVSLFVQACASAEKNVDAGCSFSASNFASETLSVQTQQTCKTLKIVLPSNMTTGYRWVVNQSESTIKPLEGRALVGQDAKAATVLGAQSQQIFIFDISIKSRQKVSFEYKRDWSPEVSSKKTFLID